MAMMGLASAVGLAVEVGLASKVGLASEVTMAPLHALLEMVPPLDLNFALAPCGPGS